MKRVWWLAVALCGCGAESAPKPSLTTVTAADTDAGPGAGDAGASDGGSSDGASSDGGSSDGGLSADGLRLTDVPSSPQDATAALDADTWPEDVEPHDDATATGDASMGADADAGEPTPDVAPPADVPPPLPDVVPSPDVVPPPDIAPAVDVPPAPDVAPPVDVPATVDVQPPADAGPTYSAPLATVDEVVLALSAHGAVPLATKSVLDRAYKLGGKACPGLLKVLQTTASDNFFGVCNVQNGALDVEVFGAWDLSFDAPCLVANTLQKKWSVGLPEQTTWKGSDDKQAVDLTWTKSFTVVANYGPQPPAYTWQGTQKWSKLPASWLPEGTKALIGHTIAGSAVNRTATALTGVLTIDGQSVAVDTPMALTWSSACAQPSGQIRLTGKSVVLVTFAPGPNCAPPTWSRDGLAKGPLPLTWPAWTWSCP
jgi:hypothetical protein